MADSFYPGRMNSRTSTGKKELSVSELNTLAKAVLENEPLLSGLTVSGEISNFKRNASGHCYFTLKDTQAAVSCVMFRSAAERLTFSPNNGMKVSVKGHISLYTVSGSYQLYAETMEDKNSSGDLFTEYRQLWEKLSAEGLFDSSRKMRIPVYPSRIAVITSGTGAAVMDILRILRRRWPLCKVLLLPVSVQGAEAAPQIAGALKYATRWKIADVIICGRGGGSLEDLWCFNDERVARTIAASDIPVISAVGHEPDYTIADFVADARAATPSNGAELAVPDKEECLQYLDSLSSRLQNTMEKRLKDCLQHLSDLKARRVLSDPMVLVENRRNSLDLLQVRLLSAESSILGRKENEFRSLAAALDAMSPLKVLGRGYSVVRNEKGSILRSAEGVSPGDRLRIRFADSGLACTVDEVDMGVINEKN